MKSEPRMQQQTTGASARPRVLVISHDVVGTTMAGPGIRYYHLARVLAGHVTTTLATPLPDEPAGTASAQPPQSQDPFAITGYRRRAWETLAAAVADADVCVFPSDVADEMPQLAQCAACLVVDGYDPLMAEWLALSRNAMRAPERVPQWRHDWQIRMGALARQYQIGDFFICASERQRDWWLGLLEASGRINPATFDADPSLRRLVDVVPYGLPEHPLPPPQPVIKGVWPGIEQDDQLVLWGGGLWPWLDPLTAIRAVAALRARHPRLKLVFPGTRHPNPAMAGMPNQVAPALALASELGVLDQAVFFGDWAPYADWPHILQESDVALTLHFDTVETRLAFRSRVLEYIWAGVPIVATAGDATSDLVARYGLGEITPVGDAEAVAAAIDRLLAVRQGVQDGVLAAAFATARAALSWERAAEPLIRFCRAPQRAPDREGDTLYYDPTGPLRAEREWLREERTYWKTLAEGYAGGHVMRALTWAGNTKRKFFGG
jgi:glycosyltransferase involved in cell wall biosynthesis